MPDAGAGNPFSHEWWLAVIILATITGFGGFFYAWFSRWMRQRDEYDKSIQRAIDTLSKSINTLFESIGICKIRCAESRAEMMTKSACDRKNDKLESLITRVQERLEKIAEKMGV